MRLWERLRKTQNARDLVHRLGWSPERSAVHRSCVLSNYRSLLRLSRELHARLAPAAGEFVLAAARDRFRRHALERAPDVIARLRLRGAHAEITVRRALACAVCREDGPRRDTVENEGGVSRGLARSGRSTTN